MEKIYVNEHSKKKNLNLENREEKSMEENKAVERNLNMYLPNVKFEAIPINQLVSDQAYQRVLSGKHVKMAAAHFDIHQINPVKVSRRNGINYVFNGQHTMEIVAKVSGSKETPVWCMVYEDLEYRTEADIFANQQKFVKSLTPFEIFKANTEAGSDKQLLIKDLVESYHLELVSFPKQNGIMAVAALEYIYDKYGYEILSRTLRLCIGAWEGHPQSLGASVLKGIARVLKVFDTEIKDAMFIEKLGNVSIKEIIRSAKEIKGGAMGYAEAIVMEYNRRGHDRLSRQKLFDRIPPRGSLSIEESLKEALAQTQNSQRTDSTLQTEDGPDHGTKVPEGNQGTDQELLLSQ